MVSFIDNYFIANYKSEPNIVISNIVIIHIDTINFRCTIIKQESFTNFISIINRSNQFHNSNTHPYYSFDYKSYSNLIKVKRITVISN